LQRVEVFLVTFTIFIIFTSFMFVLYHLHQPGVKHECTRINEANNIKLEPANG